MRTILDPRSAHRLTNLCGMLGSDHAGERANDAERADALVRGLGLTWGEIIAIPASTPREPKTVPEKIAYVLANIDALSDWERGFIYQVNRRRTISPKQLVVLEQILAKARAYRAGAS
jgi:hypothetical protein